VEGAISTLKLAVASGFGKNGHLRKVKLLLRGIAPFISFRKEEKTSERLLAALIGKGSPPISWRSFSLKEKAFHRRGNILKKPQQIRGRGRIYFRSICIWGKKESRSTKIAASLQTCNKVTRKERTSSSFQKGAILRSEKKVVPRGRGRKSPVA